MMVRCGACRSQFDAPGPGRYACPACGSVNMIREQAPQSQQATGGSGGYPVAPGVAPTPPPPPPERTVPKIECPECGYSFHVGEVAKVICPMCSSEVITGLVDLDEDEGPEPEADDSEE